MTDIKGTTTLALLDLLQDIVSELKRRDSEDINGGLKIVSKPTVTTPSTFRESIIKLAKEDLVRFKSYGGRFYQVKDPIGGTFLCDATFIVDRKKRTVVVLLKGHNSGKIRGKGVAKCAPEDTFNEHLGKAIALRRAMGIRIPADYFELDNPEVPKIGDVIHFPGNRQNYVVVGDPDVSNSGRAQNLYRIGNEVDRIPTASRDHGNAYGGTLRNNYGTALFKIVDDSPQPALMLEISKLMSK